MKVSRSAGVPWQSSVDAVVNHTTARTGWSKSMNIAVMECCFLSKPIDDVGMSIRGYRQRMHKIWNERQTLKVTE